MDKIPAVFLLLAGFLLGCIFGALITNVDWKRDCDVLQKHRSDGRVYYCVTGEKP